MKVVTTLFESNARQIPQMLRKLADDIERLTPTPDEAIMVIRDSKTGRFNIYGWGDTTTERGVHMLALAQHKLLGLSDGGDLWPIPVGGTMPKEPA
jgi:hypothetical protein